MALKNALIGYTGFVGGNLLSQHSFDDLYNSKNIESIEGHSYELLVCSGAPAEKWKANQNPGADRASIDRLIKSLRTVKATRMVLISTVDVYPLPVDVDEKTIPDWELATPYGRHRRQLEEFAAQHFPALIVRLPGLFGPGIKKNIIYDFLHGNRVDNVHADAQFQFYGLQTLWADIERAREANIRLLNMATEPVSVMDVAHRAFGLDFQNRPEGSAPARYDMQSIHAALFGGDAGYLQTKAQVLTALRHFVIKEKSV